MLDLVLANVEKLQGSQASASSSLFNTPVAGAIGSLDETGSMPLGTRVRRY